jgi:predicted transposase YbfD/YdcC
MIRINFVALTKAFNQWAAATFEVAAGEQLATDGKSIKASVKDYDRSYQDFVSVVSAFSTSQGIVLGLEPMSNLSSSEIVTVQSLLEVLAVKGVCFSMDALHTQKKTVQQIVESGNDYLIAVKGNQPKLYQEISNQFESGDNGDTNIQTDNSHGRIVTRTVNVSDRVERIATDWVGVSRIIGVERTGLRGGKPFAEKVYYLSSVADNALGFASRIREHWQVENRLHWVKDVVLSEDRSPVCDGYAIANFAILRTMAINLLRREGFSSITKGLRFLAHDLNRLFSCCQS